MLRLLLALVIVFPLAALPGSAEAQKSVRPAKAKLRTKTARVKRLWPAAKRALPRRKSGRSGSSRLRANGIPDVTGSARSFRSPLDGSLRRDVTGGGAARQKRGTGVPDLRGPAPSFFRRDTRKPSRPTEGPRSGPRELGGGRA